MQFSGSCLNPKFEQDKVRVLQKLNLVAMQFHHSIDRIIEHGVSKHLNHPGNSLNKEQMHGYQETSRLGYDKDLELFPFFLGSK